VCCHWFAIGAASSHPNVSLCSCTLPSQPENLLLKEDSYTSEIKIADFGLSQLVSRATSRDTAFCGAMVW
jgi:serine/threonine protein kinase